MLDKQDLQAIKELIDASVTASEERMTAKIDASIAASEERTQAKMGTMEERLTGKIDASIAASEERTQAKMGTMEERLTAKIDASENRIMAYIETAVMPNFQLLAEGHQTLLETLAPKSRVDDLEDDVIFLKSVVKSLMQEVSELKKAQ